MTKSKELARQAARSEAARLLAQERWAGIPPADRSEFAREVAAHRTPEQMGAAKRSDKPRCPCGEMTLARAQARRHKCEAPPTPKKKKSKATL